MIEHEQNNQHSKRSLIVVFSYHHKNTEKIARVIADVLEASVKTPDQVSSEDLQGYDLIGFGSGIYSGTFAPSILHCIEQVPQDNTKKAFLFSTYGAPAAFVDQKFVEKNHQQARERLKAKGYEVIGEFGCAGWNTNSFLKYFGGINKGRPNVDDIRNAKEFAGEIKRLLNEGKSAPGIALKE